MSKPKRNFDNFDSGEPKLTDKQQAFMDKRAAMPEPPPLDKPTTMFVQNTLRRNGWVKSRVRQSVLVAARISRGIYLCASCGEGFPPGDVEVDHAKSCISPDGPNSIEDFARRLFCPAEYLACLCKNCHRLCSNYDNNKR